METSLILLPAVIVGVVQMLKKLEQREFWAAGTIAVSGAIGAGFGLFDIEGLTVASGLAAGFAASGLVTISEKFGSK